MKLYQFTFPAFYTSAPDNEVRHYLIHWDNARKVFFRSREDAIEYERKMVNKMKREIEEHNDYWRAEEECYDSSNIDSSTLNCFEHAYVLSEMFAAWPKRYDIEEIGMAGCPGYIGL